MSIIKNLFLCAVLILLTAMPSNSQPVNKKYDAAWKKVEGFVEKGLPQSALEEVKKIYAQAKAEKADAQVIKAAYFMFNLQEETRENNNILSIAEIEKEIQSSKEPVTSIFESMLADIYLKYYYRHRWELYSRTETINFNKSDLATWSIGDFHAKLSSLFQQSLQPEKLLQSTSLATYEAILVKGNVRHLRPTLYDLLAFRALGYFQNDERDLRRPAYTFEIDKASAFDPAADFIHARFPSADTASLKHKALLIWQKLIAFHLNDANPAALIDADILRLSYVRQHSTHPDKDQLYFYSINHLANQYGDQPAAAPAWFALAAWYEEKASSYVPYGDSTHRLSRVKAKEILEKIVKQKEASEAKANAHNLLQTIINASLSFEMEQVNIPDLPFRSLVTYRNIDKVYFRLVPMNDKLREAFLNVYDEKFWPTLLAQTASKSWEQALPGSGDLQNHRAEVKMDGLPVGDYLLVASANKNFTTGKSVMGVGRFYVSRISYVNQNENHFVLDRDNGQPLAGASVQVWEQQYDYRTSKYTKKKGNLLTSEKNGWFFVKTPLIEKNTRAVNYALEINHKNDRLFIEKMNFTYYGYGEGKKTEPEPSSIVYLFIDRAIYRPGQTVHFKGIVIRTDPRERNKTVDANYVSTIVLRDANYKEIDSIKVTTNEYGSFSGKFTLPQGGLNGQFTLFSRSGYGHAGLKVEEYKRPKFFVDYEPLKNTYRVNDTIRVTGFAKAYAGNNIDNAKVKYRVVRRARFLYPWIYKRFWLPTVLPLEIAHGEITTDRNGNFIIPFTAIPDLSIDKKLDPVFDYVVYADVTDQNGETRSAEKTITAGYKSLLIKSTIPASLPTDSLNHLAIRTENMNGEFQPASVKVVMTQLRPEQRLIRKRYWERPDQFVMSKEEYVRHFPNDEYDNETDYAAWTKSEVVLTRTDSSRADGKWPLANRSFNPGVYQVEITTTDKDGAVVRDLQYLELYDQKNNKLAVPLYLWTGKPDTQAEPGENGKIEIGTSMNDQFVVQQILRQPLFGKADPEYSYVKLNNEKRSFSFPVGENDRGGFSVGYMFIRNNRLYQVNEIIGVPWTNKELEVEYSSYRDKTEPGSSEKWTLRITGYKKEMAAAELLAGMYDASLDQFVPHSWSTPSVWPQIGTIKTWNGADNFSSSESVAKYPDQNDYMEVDKRYDAFIWDEGYSVFAPQYLRAGNGILNYARAETAGMKVQRKMEKDGDVPMDVLASTDQVSSQEQEQQKSNNNGAGAIIRNNFRETAFFFPDLRTDANGAIEFSFTIPDALTKWKFMALAHTKGAAFGNSTKEIVTQKELMVQPNPPRFLREGDKMEFSTKIVNMSDKEMTGTVEFNLFDAETDQPVDGAFRSMVANQYFTVAAGQSELVKFPIEIPYLYNRTVLWRIVAKSGNYSDGEENILPVLTNRMLVTETIPLHMRGNGTKTFSFDKLLNSGNSESLQHHALTIEYTSNPAWYAIQALPYLAEYPYECAEQNWNRYFANSLAAHIAGSSPRIREIFERWRITDTAALVSNLQKNQELKSILLEETPWVLDAKSETEQRRNIALLFDMVKMTAQLNTSFEKLKQMQSPNGGFVWFTGGPDDRYITQYIVSGIGHLQKMGAVLPGQKEKLQSILETAIPYLDSKLKEDYDQLVKSKSDLKKYVPGYYTIHYMYMRSFFTDVKIPASSKVAYDYFRGRMQQSWTTQSKYMQGMIALALHRTADSKTPAAILKSLKETSINHEELGMYWKDQRAGWFWYEAPIETQSLLIETFHEIGNDKKIVDDLRTWLLKNKQTNNWKTTKATAEACYALLLQGTDWLSAEPQVTIQLGEGNRSYQVKSTDVKHEAGTGYFKETIKGENVNSTMGKIQLTVASADKTAVSTSWGGIYWQYFEDLDKITNASTPLKLVKKLFIEKNTDRGPVLTPVNNGDVIKTGDKIKVRVELRVDRDMEYVHMKDMRASALEPENVLSSYKWQGGLGYYESTKDASTNFFFNYLRKGTYVFEYALFATHTGEFSNGVTTIQSMYAPEFTSHSEGVRITIE